jgi:hypothetical protein
MKKVQGKSKVWTEISLGTVIHGLVVNPTLFSTNWNAEGFIAMCKSLRIAGQAPLRPAYMIPMKKPYKF